MHLSISHGFIRFCAAMALVLLTGCAQWMGPRTYVITPQDIQHRVAQKFPLERDALGFFKVALDHPQVTLLPQADRIATAVDFHATEGLMHHAVAGTLTLSFGLAYDPSRQAVTMHDVNVDRLEMQGLAPPIRDALQAWSAALLPQLLEGSVLHQFKPADLQRADALGYTVGGIDVTEQGLVVRLVEK
jgi:hypothetical protein